MLILELCNIIFKNQILHSNDIIYSTCYRNFGGELTISFFAKWSKYNKDVKLFEFSNGLDTNNIYFKNGPNTKDITIEY